MTGATFGCAPVNIVFILELVMIALFAHLASHSPGTDIKAAIGFSDWSNIT